MVLEQAQRRKRMGFTVWDYLRSVDWILLGAALALVAYGMIMIYSATHADPGLSSPTYYVKQQAVGLGIGFVALVGLSLMNYTRFAQYKKYLYAVMILLLGVTLVIGAERMGARRWIELPFFDLQSSEVAKLLLIVTLAAFLAEGIELRSRFRFVLLSVGYVVVPALLVYLEPDLGTALVFGAVLTAMLLVWGVRWSHAAYLAVGAAGVLALILRVLPSLGVNMLKEYQFDRLMVFVDPERDPTGTGYQLIQSKIAVASGMHTGKGFMEGTQTHLNFLPFHHTDFIFAVVAEELGFLGAMIMLGLFAVIIWRAIRIANRALDLYGTLICAGVIGMVVFQVFVNVGMTIGIMPVTGIPLPFMSAGASSLVVFLAAVGLLESVQVRSKLGILRG